MHVFIPALIIAVSGLIWMALKAKKEGEGIKEDPTIDCWHFEHDEYEDIWRKTA